MYRTNIRYRQLEKLSASAWEFSVLSSQFPYKSLFFFLISKIYFENWLKWIRLQCEDIVRIVELTFALFLKSSFDGNKVRILYQKERKTLMNTYNASSTWKAVKDNKYQKSDKNTSSTIDTILQVHLKLAMHNIYFLDICLPKSS